LRGAPAGGILAAMSRENVEWFSEGKDALEAVGLSD
jgi:hypothetical protein